MRFEQHVERSMSKKPRNTSEQSATRFPLNLAQAFYLQRLQGPDDDCNPQLHGTRSRFRSMRRQARHAGKPGWPVLLRPCSLGCTIAAGPRISDHSGPFGKAPSKSLKEAGTHKHPIAAWPSYAAEEAGAHPVCEAWAAMCGPPPELCFLRHGRALTKREVQAQRSPSQAAQQRRMLPTATALLVWQSWSRSLPETCTGVLAITV